MTTIKQLEDMITETNIRLSVVESELLQIKVMETQLTHITDKLKKSRLL